MRWIAVAKLLRSRMFVLAAAVLWVPGTAGSAAAEWFLDLYSGAAFTNAEDVEARWTVLGGTIEGLFKEVDFDTSVVFGGRVGYRFVGLPFFAVALDVWHFRPDVGAQTVRATNVRLNGVPSGIGVQAGAGFTWLFRRNVGVFAEYRFSHFAPEIRVGDWRFETNVNTHSVLGGLTLRF